MTMSLVRMVEQLARIENLAFEFYQKTQDFPGLSAGFIDFLRDCAEEEAWRLNALKKANRLLEGKEDIVSGLEIDTRTRERIETPFKNILGRAGGRPFSERELMAGIAAAEFSEWSALFVHIMGRLKDLSGESLYPAARVQSHLQRVIDYFELAGFEHHKLRRLKTLPRVWEESILAVDGDPAIRELVAGILKTEGRVDLARDGREALELLKNHYYKVIVSGLEMPHLDGLGFFRRAREIHPRIARRFIFLSAKADLLNRDEPGLKAATLLEKPFRAWELIEKVNALLAGK